MKRIYVRIVVALSFSTPAIAQTSPERSLPDTYPECTRVNGPDCVLPAPVVVPPRMAAPRGLITQPLPVAPPAVVESGPRESPAMQRPPPGTRAPGAGAAEGTAGPAASAREGSTPSQRATVIGPRK